ncbi:MAG TPA: hypothetical protein VIK33_19525 [Anaerolineae bacterium]
MSQDVIQRVTAIKRKYEKEWMRLPNVVGVGVGYRTRGGVRSDEVSIVVSVKKKVPASQLKSGEVIPSSIEGVPVDVVETGEIRAM